MNNIERVRESISDASYALTQVGEDAPHLTLLVMQERLKRLVDLEYALLTGLGENREGESIKKDADGWIANIDGRIPCPRAMEVEVVRQDGEKIRRRAGRLDWSLDLGKVTLVKWRFHSDA